MNALDKVIGQDRPKQLLKLLGQSFTRRNHLPPVGIFGASGLGKTHLVDSFCEWIDANQIYINGTAVKDPIAFRELIKEAARNPNQHNVVFVDECHNLPKKVQENLLSVLENPSILCTVANKDMGNVRCVDGVRFIEKGDVMREELPSNVSFFFATTDPVMLKDTILNRLRKIHLESYSLEDKADIAMAYLMSQDVTPTAELCVSLAERARSIRHLKNDLCDTYVDIYLLDESAETDEILAQLDDMLGLDEQGATDQDIDYLEYLATHEIAGVDTMSGYLRTDKKDIVMRIEPFLIESGWIKITGKGRVLTKTGREKMGLPPEEVHDLSTR